MTLPYLPQAEDAIANFSHSHFRGSPPFDLVAKLRGYSSRRELARRRWDLLNDNAIGHLLNEIETRFKQEENRRHLAMFCDSSCNAYKAIIDKISTVYREPPRREFHLARDTKLFQKVVDVGELDLLMEEINRITMALNECLVMPVARDWGKTDFEIIRPDQCEVRSRGRRIDAVAYAIEQGYVYLDDRIMQLFGTNGEPNGPTFANPWGKIPVTVYRRKMPTDGFWLGSSGEDLVSLYFDQVIYRSWISAIAYFQSHKELAKKQTTEESQSYGQVRDYSQAGPNVVLDGEYTVLDMRTDVGPHIEAAEAKLRRAAANWGVSYEALTQAKSTSGLDRVMSQSGIIEVRMGSIKLFRLADRNLMNDTSIVHNATGYPEQFSVPDKLDPRIDYAEPRIVESPKEKRETLKVGMELGVDSPVDQILDSDPDIKDRNEAMKIIKRNLEETGTVLEARRSFSAPEQIAAALGAVGGVASGVARTNQVSPDGEADNMDPEDPENG